MKTLWLVMLGGLVGLNAACSSHPSDPGNGGPTLGGVASPGECPLIAGNYVFHYTLLNSGANAGVRCQELPDQTLYISNAPPDSGAPPPDGSSCSSSFDSQTCTTTLSCTIDANGMTTAMHIEIASAAGHMGGDETIRLTSDATGQVLSDCSYAFTYQKQQ